MSGAASDDDVDWLGSVIRSEIDHRVWIAVLSGGDMQTRAMAASTSIRRCKEHVREQLAREGFSIAWRKTEEGEWEAIDNTIDSIYEEMGNR